MRNISDVKELLATTHAAHTLELNADSTEFCPIQGYEDILAVGTYQLQEELQERIGQLLIYKLRWQSGQPGATAQEGDNLQEASKNVSTCGSANSLILKPVPQLCHTTRVPGIFDLKWQPVIGSTGFGAVPVLGGALADGSLRLYALQQDEQVHTDSTISPAAAHCISSMIPTYNTFLHTVYMHNRARVTISARCAQFAPLDRDRPAATVGIWLLVHVNLHGANSTVYCSQRGHVPVLGLGTLGSSRH